MPAGTAACPKGHRHCPLRFAAIGVRSELFSLTDPEVGYHYHNIATLCVGNFSAVHQDPLAHQCVLLSAPA